MVTWDVHDNQRRDWWGIPVVPFWYTEASLVLDLDGNPQPLVMREDKSEMAVTVGANSFSYTREPGEEVGFKLGAQLCHAGRENDSGHRRRTPGGRSNTLSLTKESPSSSSAPWTSTFTRRPRLPRNIGHRGIADMDHAAGFRAVLVKSHHHSMVTDIAAVDDAIGGLPIPVYSGVALNNCVGGINPDAVELSLQMGGRMFGCPRCLQGSTFASTNTKTT